MPKRSLSFYITGILVLLVLITSSLFFYLEARDQADVLRIHEQSKAKDISFVIQSLINNEVEKLYALSRSLMGHEDLLVNVALATVHDENPKSFEDLLERLVKELNLDLLIITDEDGLVLYNSYVPKERGHRLGYRDLTSVLMGDEELFAMYFDGVWHITSAVPLFLGDLQVGTLLVATRMDDEFATIFAKATNTELTLGDATGVLASSIPPEEQDRISQRVMRQSLSMNTLIRKQVPDTTKVLGYSPVFVLDKPLSLAVEFDSGTLIELYNHKKRAHLKIFGIITAISLLIGTLMTIRIVSPLKRLRLKAEGTIHDITGQELASASGDEVASLVESFDIMLSTVSNHLEERQKLEEKLKQQALYDSLTGLPNRTLFLDRLTNLFGHKRRDPDLLFALLFIDLDHFKKINDSLGHVAGDQMLVAAAERLRACTRPGDTVARFGGDEFVIVMDGIASDDDALLAAERIHRQIEQPFVLSGTEIYTSASIGIAISFRMYDSPEDFLRDADTAMYQAKERGRARHVLFDPSMHESAVRSMKIESELRRALEKNEFVLHYQPVVEIQSGQVIGFESLIRWQHPEKGLLFPSDFIGIAEETGLIMNIGEWVILEACRQARQWQNMFNDSVPLTISVNLSAKEFNVELLETVKRAIKQSSIEPGALGIEVTESLIMADSNLALTVLTHLRELGVRIYLDDFGTGYSSLNYIHKFPLNVLKIDRTFVSNILNDLQAQEIVRAIISLGKRLGLRIIIEGIDEERELELFRSFGCDLVQGYLFSEPLSASQVPVYLETHTP